MNDKISQSYLDLQQQLHLNPNYGVASLHYAAIVASLFAKTNCRSISDYGAGKKRLLEGLAKAGIQPAEYYPYDPAFPEYGEPRPADLVCCIDVLEHVEPEFVDNVILDLTKIVTKFGFFSIHTGPAAKTLLDGRNAHLIQQPTSWWLKKIIDHFEVIQLQSSQTMGHGFWLIVSPKK